MLQVANFEYIDEVEAAAEEAAKGHPWKVSLLQVTRKELAIGKSC